jgi:hypothetical protein
VWVDVAVFDAAARAARGSPDPAAYRAALDRYAGDLLPDEPYEDWATSRREGDLPLQENPVGLDHRQEEGPHLDREGGCSSLEAL